MTAVDWRQEINFASALLLHSCLTVLVKEACNIITLLYRSTLFSKNDSAGASSWQSVRSSAILDAYTSIFSKDEDGELAELYYTNTGALLLASTLAASVAMNLYLSDNVLNGIIVGTFAFCFVASLAVGKGRFTIFIVALRRAGRFIWADTPFVNFFSLIYIATVLHGSPMLRVKDYVAFRSIAVFELLFMKAKLAASSVEQQQIMMKRLIQTGLTILKSVSRDSLCSPKLHGSYPLSRPRSAHLSCNKCPAFHASVWQRFKHTRDSAPCSSRRRSVTNMEASLVLAALARLSCPRSTMRSRTHRGASAFVD